MLADAARGTTSRLRGHRGDRGESARQSRHDLSRRMAGRQHAGRLRPDRDAPAEVGGRGRRGRVPASRAGAARGLRVLRVRPRAASTWARTRAVPEGRRACSGTAPTASSGLAQLIAERAPRREIARHAPRARRALDDAAASARRQREHAPTVDHQHRDHRLPRGPRGRADPRRDHGRMRRRAQRGCAARSCSAAAARRSLATVVTWVLAQTLLELARAVRREARGDRVGLVAIGVLLLITQLVLPPRLLERVDRRPSTAGARSSSSSRAPGSLLRRPGRRPRAPRASRASTARASRPCSSCSRSARGGHRHGARGRRDRPRATLAVGVLRSASSASCPTRRC